MKLSLFFTTAFCLFGSLGATTVFDSDFGDGQTLRPIVQEGNAGKISGSLPPEWLENSSGWSAAEASVNLLEENGKNFSRIDIKDLKGGRVQLCRHSGQVTENQVFRISVEYRNPEDIDVAVGLRLKEHPYTFIKSFKLSKTQTWREDSFIFTADKDKRDSGIWINISGIGCVDLKRVKLEQLNPDELIAESKRRQADGSPANLLRNPVLPLGLQTGWMLKRDLSDDEFSLQPDSSVKGPSGADSLKVIPPADKELVFSSEIFRPLLIGETHVFSLRYKGDGAVSINVKDNQKGIGSSKTFVEKDGWKIVSAKFNPGLAPELCYAQISVSGAPIWIDAMEAAPASSAGSFSMPSQAIVSLALPESDASSAKVQFEDEKAEVKYKISGQFAGTLLKAKLVNLYGEEKELPSISVSGSDAGIINYEKALGKRPFGAFRIEAFLEKDGKAVSPVNEIIVNRLRRPHYWGKDAPASSFGVHMYSTARNIIMAKAIGANWTRLHDSGLEYCGWWNLETEKGKWRFFDKEIYRFRNGKIKIFGELGTAPVWGSYYKDSGLKTFGYFDKFFQPLNLEDYDNYVKTVTSRYKGVINEWDVWNEPWISAYWAVGYDKSKKDRDGYFTGKEPQKDYVRLTETAFKTAKNENPEAFILGFNTTTSNNQGGSLTHIPGNLWTKGVMENDGLKSCDALSYHEYINDPGTPGDPENPMKKRFANSFAPLLEKYGAIPKEVWMTEGSSTNAHGVLGFGLARASIPGLGADKYMSSSNSIVRYMLNLSSFGVSRWFLYSMHSYDMNPVRDWAVLVCPDGSLHPSAAAHSALAYFIEDRKYIKTVPDGKDRWALIFEGKDGVVAALAASPSSGSRKYSLPENCEAFDLFGNPLPREFEADSKVFYIKFKNLNDAEAFFSR